MAEAVRWRKHAHPPEVEFIDAVPEDRSSQINSEVCKAALSALSAEHTKAGKMTQNKLQNDPFLKDKDNEMKRSGRVSHTTLTWFITCWW